MGSGIPTGAPGERAVFALLVALAVVVGVVVGGAELAAAFVGHHLMLSESLVASALVHLPAHLVDPRLAWGQANRVLLPGPAVYWVAQGVVLAVTLGLVALLVTAISSGRRTGTRQRVRLGVQTEARLATRADIAPLVVKGPVPGRLILGTVGGRLVATEVPPRALSNGHPWRPGQRGGPGRQGGRGSVCVVGPSQSGKTNLIKRGVLDWVEGPAVLGSVKSDLLAHSAGARARLGDVKVFDPLETTGLANARWNPLDTCTTPSGAQNFAAALGAASPTGNVTNSDFFQRQAEGLLWALLYLAGATHVGFDMTDVVRWVMTHSRPGDVADGALGGALGQLVAESEDAEAIELVHEALEAVWRNDNRTRGSIYTTAQNFVAPWMDQLVRRWTRGSDISLEWLCNGNNTLYVCLPMGQRKRLAPVFGGVYGALMDAAYDRYNQTATVIDPTLLVVIDEAANTRVEWLPEVAATCAGIGILLVTVWQGVSQLDSAFGRQAAEAVLTNHPTKAFLSGISDQRSLEYVSRLLGEEEVIKTSVSSGGTKMASVGESGQQMRLVPMDVIRQVAPGEGILVHRTLRPAHLRIPLYYKDRRLSDLAQMAYRGQHEPHW
jgi:type IV secretory pathway TraG/TraD family ATPase VirD4